ncbi:ABC transporter substrate-binding protein [Leucobacter sp. CSA2]|uniref:ABC transporter substrate-binding protein n=1 Tax=Leucobacter edaphi TaxID=2796472 RepID=A0A934UXL3_9MICO|nr:ABC transporter substrate-binding protein [Leucobacter edaphi]MBK0421731.1 ABC transporter substrate-binding protein [Leucobacter edaphi]
MKMRTVIICGLAASSLLLSGCSGTTSAGGQAQAGEQAGIAISKNEGATKYPLKIQNCGTEVTVERAPEHAVTLDQPSAEILIRLGLADRIAGSGYEVDAAPEEIAEAYGKIPQLSKKDEPITHETLLGAQPDFVLSHYASFFAADKAGERKELQEHKVPTYLTEFDCAFQQKVENVSFDTLFTEYENLAKIFDVPSAGKKLIETQQAALKDGLETAKKITGKPKLMWFYSTYNGAPFAAGPGGLPQHVTELVGAENVFADAKTKWPETSWDEVAARNPDVIVLADLTRGKPGDSAKEKIELLKKDPVTSKLEAVKHDRFVIVPGSYMDPSYGSVYAVPKLAEGLVGLQ